MPAGRPSKYKDEYAEQAYRLCLLGHTDKDMAGFFMVEEQTINNWKQEHPEFFESVTRGKDIADADVAEAFLKRAKGYAYTEKHSELIDGGLKVVKTIEKDVAPDAGAALNWLKNRQPIKWRDKKDVELSGGVATLTEEERLARIESLKSKLKSD